MPEDTVQLKDWIDRFGRDYTDRNMLTIDELDKSYMAKYGIMRTALNKQFLSRLDRSVRILEVGCNVGIQLLCLEKMGFRNLYGIEPQSYAVELAKKRAKDINIIKADSFDIPFQDGYFDLVFTSGVLIHIHPKDIRKAMAEIYRCSRRYIWGFEYFSSGYEEIIYRKKKNILWKTNFSKLYLDLFDDLQLMKERKIKYLSDGNIDVMFLLKKKR